MDWWIIETVTISQCMETVWCSRWKAYSRCCYETQTHVPSCDLSQLCYSCGNSNTAAVDVDLQWCDVCEVGGHSGCWPLEVFHPEDEVNQRAVQGGCDVPGTFGLYQETVFF